MKSRINNFRKNKSVKTHFTQLAEIDKLERTKELVKLKLDGWSVAEMVEYLKINHNLSGLSADIAINDVRGEIKKIAAEIIIDIIEDHYFKYESLYKKACDIDNSKLQLKILDAKEKLLGLTSETQANLIINNIVGELNTEKLVSLSKENFDQTDLSRIDFLFNKISKGMTRERAIIDITSIQKK